MKRLILSLIVLVCMLGCGGGTDEETPKTGLKPIDHQWSDYSALLTDYVADGLVDYKTMKADRARVDALVDTIAVADVSEATDDQALAFYINAYNILLLRSIIDAYPVQSVKDIDGVFNRKQWAVSGKEYTLDELENDVIRADFSDPRVHFALCKAALGGPKLQSVPYLGDILDEQLTKAGKAFVTDTRYNWIDPEKKKVGLSKLFKWYGKDFHKEYYLPGSMMTLCQEDNASVNFILSYMSKDRQTKLRAINFKAEYLDFDWSLNEQ